MIFYHLRLFTSDLIKQQAFYEDTLELPLLEQSKESIVFRVGGSRLEFVQVERDVFYHFAFNVPSHQFADAKTWLSERAPLIQDASGNDEFHSQNWNADMFYFYDVSRNIVEFIARHDLKSKLTEPFSARSLECISELGIVTDNVPRTVEQIQNLTGASLYRATMDEQFVPVGDEMGLFIIVRRERIWFPETKPAVAAPFQVNLSNQGKPLMIDNHRLRLS